MGLMVDRPTHYDDLTGRANAYFFARAYGMEKAKAEGALAELFEYFDLAEYADDRVKTYFVRDGQEARPDRGAGARAGGAAAGRAFARARLHLAARLSEQDQGPRRLGIAVLLASNQVDEVEALCDRAAFLHRGEVVAEGTPEDLISRVEGVRRIVATLRNPVEYGSVAQIGGVQRVVPEGRDLIFHCEERPGIVADVVAGIVRSGGDIVNLSVQRPNLEDVFVKLTGEALRDEV